VPVVLFDNDNPFRGSHSNIKPKLTSNFIWGFLSTNDLTEFPADILLAIDDVVVDSTHTSRFDRSRHEFQFLIPSSFLEGKKGKTELFLVNSKIPNGPLKRIVVTSYQSVND
jgi:hypothetical protein